MHTSPALVYQMHGIAQDNLRLLSFCSYKCCLKNLERISYPLVNSFLPSSDLSWRQRRYGPLVGTTHIASSGHPAVRRVWEVLEDVVALVLGLDAFVHLVHLRVSVDNNSAQ